MEQNEQEDKRRTACKELFNKHSTFKNPSFWHTWKKAFDLGSVWQLAQENEAKTAIATLLDAIEYAEQECNADYVITEKDKEILKSIF